MRFIFIIIGFIIVIGGGLWLYRYAMQEKMPPELMQDMAAPAENSNNEQTGTGEAERLQEQQKILEQRKELVQQQQATPYEIESKRLEQQAELLRKQEEVLRQQQRVRELQQGQTAPVTPPIAIKPVTKFGP